MGKIKKFFQEQTLEQRAIYLAVKKGYKVSNNYIIGPSGKPLKMQLRGKAKYPFFKISSPGITNRGYIEIRCHRFAAYIYYGDQIFKKGMHVRHRNGDVYNISRENILLGTVFENHLDRKELNYIGTLSSEKGYTPKYSYSPDWSRQKDLEDCIEMNLPQASQAILLAYTVGYRVNNEGIVLNPWGQTVEGSIVNIKGKIKSRAVKQFSCRGNNIRVHRFAAFCFFGKELFKPKLVVRHLNGNSLDNSKSNLRLGSKKENWHDMDDSITREIFRRAGYSKRKFSPEGIHEIDRQVKTGLSDAKIAKIKGVDPATIRNIRIRKIYKDVPIFT